MTTLNEALQKKIRWTKESIAEEIRARNEVVIALANDAAKLGDAYKADPELARSPFTGWVRSHADQIATYDAKIEKLNAVLEALRWVDGFGNDDQIAKKDGAK